MTSKAGFAGLTGDQRWLGRSGHSGAGPPLGTLRQPGCGIRGAGGQEARLACLSHRKVLPWAGGGKPGQPLPQGPAWAPLPPSQHLHQSILGLKGGTLKMGASCQGEPDARGGGREAPQLDGSELWSRGQTSPRPAPHHLLAAWPARPASSFVAWASTGHPPDPGWGRRPSIYWRFLDGAAKGKARSRLIPEGGCQSQENPEHHHHASCCPKGRGEDGPRGGRRLLTAIRKGLQTTSSNVPELPPHADSENINKPKSLTWNASRETSKLKKRIFYRWPIGT